MASYISALNHFQHLLYKESSHHSCRAWTRSSDFSNDVITGLQQALCLLQWCFFALMYSSSYIMFNVLLCGSELHSFVFTCWFSFLWISVISARFLMSVFQVTSYTSLVIVNCLRRTSCAIEHQRPSSRTETRPATTRRFLLTISTDLDLFVSSGYFLLCMLTLPMPNNKLARLRCVRS